MLSYYNFYCPYCKHLLTSTEHPNSYGNPLKVCAKCGKTYIDSYCTERAFFKYRPSSAARHAGGAVVVAFTVSFFPTAIAWFISQSDKVCWITFGISFLLLWLGYFLYCRFNREKISQREFELWHESDQRLRNPEYAFILKKFGYNVPSRYLSSDFAKKHDPLPYQAAWVRKPTASHAKPCTKPDANALSNRI